MRKKFSKISAIIACILLSLSMAWAGPKGKGKDRRSNESASAGAPRTRGSVFEKGDRDRIWRHYYSLSRNNLPPGLARRGGDLPPGLAKQLQRNGHLPPGLEKKLRPFPAELERRLPPLRQGLTRGILGNNAIIIDRTTSAILDIFSVF